MKKILALFSLLALTLSAFAQVDMATAPSVLLFAPITNAIQSAATAQTFYTKPADIHGRQGLGLALISWAQNGQTNGGTSAQSFTLTIQESADASSWTTVSNIAVATKTPISNVSGSVTYDAPAYTNQTFLFGTWTTATPATAGFAGKYLSPAAFTSTGAFDADTTGSGNYCVALPMQSMKRFVRLKCDVGGSNNVTTVSGTMVLKKQANHYW